MKSQILLCPRVSYILIEQCPVYSNLELSSVRFSHRDLVLRNEAGLSAPINQKLSPMLKGPEIRSGPHRPLELHKITRSRLGRVG